MKVLGIIAEYNPFHNGHLHHLQESRIQTECTHAVAVMSGHFLQRGEPALMDKWSRARAAVHSGIDLVLELPYAYSCQSAEIFAYGGVRILNDCKIVDVLAFGSESRDLQGLWKTAQTLASESEAFQEALHRYLKEGVSFAKARELALQEDGLETFAPKKSNDILGLEYLKWLIRLNSSIEPHLIQRHKVEYHDTKPVDRIASATYIRNLVLNHSDFDKELSSLVPQETAMEMERYLEQNRFNRLDHYLDLIRSDLIRTTDNTFRGLGDVREGLEHRFLEHGPTSENVDDLIHKVVSKRYTQTRISRILCHLLHRTDLVNPLTFFVDRDFTPYLRVLAFNDKGRSLLRRIRKQSDNPVITNLGRSRRLLNEDQKKCLQLDLISSDLFFLKANSLRIREDYFRNPEYVKM